MAITSYSELQTAAANWLARTDLTSRIPEFIALAEAKFNRILRTRDMETKNAAFSITGEYVAVPTGFLEARSFMTNANPRTPILYMPGETQETTYPTTNSSPLFYSVVGGNFRFAPVPSSTITATLVYYQAITGLATTSPNWLLTSHPDLYLYGTLMEASDMIQDDQRSAKWEQKFATALGQLRKMDNASRWGGNGMAVRTA